MGNTEIKHRTKSHEETIGEAMALNLAAEEINSAMSKFEPFNSPHEGLAVIEEEFLELREAVFWSKDSREAHMKEEAIQLAAMALRFLVDCCKIQEEITVKTKQSY